VTLAGILVVSEIFPPAIGGSGALLENVYRRISDVPLRVLAHGTPTAQVPADRVGALDVSLVSMSAPDWGVVRPAALRRHVRVARAIRRRMRGWPCAVHCARALPEGLSAALGVIGSGAPYVCWTHGEELGFASTSRELTWLARRVYARATAVIANSRNSARLLESTWAVPPHRIHVVYPGVDADVFVPGRDAAMRGDRLRAGRDDLVLLSVGRLQRRKGHDLVLQALPRVRDAVRNVKYVVVGDGPHRSTLETQAQALGLGDIVQFHGTVGGDDLPRFYAAADVFVLPNRDDGVDFEGFGIVFLEAAASGLPVVAGRSGGAPEAVEDGVTGVLVSGIDPEELASSLIRLGESADLRRRLGEAGRARVVTRFTWQASADAVRSLHAGMFPVAVPDAVREVAR
jgi:phosphatidylinositol alpha-1,6-mannosyltransferase